MTCKWHKKYIAEKHAVVLCAAQVIVVFKGQIQMQQFGVFGGSCYHPHTHTYIFVQ